MLLDKPLNCICGIPPSFLKKPVAGIGSVEYHGYACEKCDIATFFTREEECCRELWNATIQKKLNSQHA